MCIRDRVNISIDINVIMFEVLYKQWHCGIVKFCRMILIRLTLIMLVQNFLTDPAVWRTNRQKDGRTELRWLRHAKAVAAFARKNYVKWETEWSFDGQLYQECSCQLFLNLVICLQEIIDNAFDLFWDWVYIKCI